MFFDGASSKEGVRARIWVMSPKTTPTLHSFKLMFNCTNNVDKYEALMLGLNILKEKKERKFYVYGDSELVIKKVNGLYQTKNPKMKAYQNGVLDVLESFTEYKIVVILINQNNVADSLSTIASDFKMLVEPSRKYEVEVRHKPFVLDNIDNWQVFENE